VNRLLTLIITGMVAFIGVMYMGWLARTSVQLLPLDRPSQAAKVEA